MSESSKFYLKMPSSDKWHEVTKAQYIAAERSAGFFPKGMWAHDPLYNEVPAGDTFNNGVVEGRVIEGSVVTIALDGTLITPTPDDNDSSFEMGQLLYNTLTKLLGLSEMHPWEKLSKSTKSRYVEAEKTIRNDERKLLNGESE